MSSSSSSSSSSTILDSVSLIATVFFATCSYWAIKKEKKDLELRKKYPNNDNNNNNNNNNDTNTAITVPPGKISSRGYRALTPPIPYLQSFLDCLNDECTVDTNPAGRIALCVAENKLCLDLLIDKLQQPTTAITTFSNDIVYGYESFLGLPMTRDAVAYFLAKRFYFTNANASLQEQQHSSSTLTLQNALQHIKPQHVAIGSGCCSMLNALFFILGEPNDACLIPAPYYAAFETDMSIIAGVVPFAVNVANPTLGPTELELDLAFMEAKSQGLRPNFLLLTNPHNPLGVIYKRRVMLHSVTWARKRGIHTIVDEIYALSTHEKYNHGFESIIKILDNQLEDNVHMVWAVSKDFGASGFRFGTVYSQNEAFIEGMANLNIFSSVSNPMQMMVAELLTNDAFVDYYLDTSRKRICANYQYCIAKLEEMVIPFVEAQAGIFVYADFSCLLPQKTMEWESRLSDLMTTYARVVLTPGQSQRDTMPGMFRICYAWVSLDVLEIAMERLSRLVAKIRRMDWEDLNETTLSGVI